MTTELVLRDTSDLAFEEAAETARRLLSESKTIPEVKSLLERTEVIQAILKKTKKSLELQNTYAEIRLNEERKLGIMLKEQPRQEIGRPNNSTTLVPFPTLKDMGISKKESAKWQKLASVPEDKFTEFIEDKFPKEPIRDSEILALAKPEKPKEPETKTPDIIPDPIKEKPTEEYEERAESQDGISQSDSLVASELATQGRPGTAHHPAFELTVAPTIQHDEVELSNAYARIKELEMLSAKDKALVIEQQSELSKFKNPLRHSSRETLISATLSFLRKEARSKAEIESNFKQEEYSSVFDSMVKNHLIESNDEGKYILTKRGKLDLNYASDFRYIVESPAPDYQVVEILRSALKLMES